MDNSLVLPHRAVFMRKSEPSTAASESTCLTCSDFLNAIAAQCVTAGNGACWGRSEFLRRGVAMVRDMHQGPGEEPIGTPAVMVNVPSADPVGSSISRAAGVGRGKWR